MNAAGKYIVQGDNYQYENLSEIIKWYPSVKRSAIVDLTPARVHPAPTKNMLTTAQLLEKVRQINAKTPNGRSWLIEQLEMKD